MIHYRIKDVARINTTALPDSTDPDFRFRYIDIGAVSGMGSILIPDEDTSFAMAPSRARRLARPGAVIVSTVRTYLRAIAAVPVSDNPLVFSTGFAVLEAGEQLDRRYLAYYCRSNPFIDEVVARSVGVSYPAINASEIGNLPMELPPLQEQRRIADFLDVETARIDKLREARRSYMHLLGERLEAVRDDLFVGNNNANPTPLMYLTNSYRPIVYGIVQAGPEYPDGVPYIKTGDLPDLNPGTLSKTSPEIHAQFRRAAVHPGDIVMAMRASIGTIAVVPSDLPEANLTQGTARIAPAPGIDGQWLFQALQTRTVLDQCNVRAVGSTFRTLNIWDLRRIVIPMVPATEQKFLMQQFAEVLSHHRNIQEATKRQLDLLAERRQALITAAVTGQIDVSTANGRGIED